MTVHDKPAYARVVLDAYAGEAPADRSRRMLYSAARSLCLAEAQEFLGDLAQLALDAGHRPRDVDTTIRRADERFSS